MKQTRVQVYNVADIGVLQEIGGGGTDVRLPDERCGHERRRGSGGILPLENFEM